MIAAGLQPRSHDYTQRQWHLTEWLGFYRGNHHSLGWLLEQSSKSLTARLQNPEPLCALAKLWLYYPSYKWKVQEMTHACRWSTAYVWNWTGFGQQENHYSRFHHSFYVEDLGWRFMIRQMVQPVDDTWCATRIKEPLIPAQCAAPHHWHLKPMEL